MRGDQMEVELSGATIVFRPAKGQETVVESDHTIHFSESPFRHVLKVKWAAATRSGSPSMTAGGDITGNALGANSYVVNSGSATAIGIGSQATTGISYGGDNSHAAGSKVVTIHVPARVAKITLKAASDFNEGAYSKVIEDRRLRRR